MHIITSLMLSKQYELFNFLINNYTGNCDCVSRPWCNFIPKIFIVVTDKETKYRLTKQKKIALLDINFTYKINICLLIKILLSSQSSVTFRYKTKI